MEVSCPSCLGLHAPQASGSAVREQPTHQVNMPLSQSASCCTLFMHAQPHACLACVSWTYVHMSVINVALTNQPACHSNSSVCINDASALSSQMQMLMASSEASDDYQRQTRQSLQLLKALLVLVCVLLSPRPGRLKVTQTQYRPAALVLT